MTYELTTFLSGPLQNNTYLVFDTVEKRALVIDPADAMVIEKHILNNRLQLDWILITHAHFDHISAVERLRSVFKTDKPHIAMHADDFDLWLSGAGAREIGFDFDPGEIPDFKLRHSQILHLGNHQIEVRHTPGHTQGHVIFYLPDLAAAFCGDLIFQNSIGRTDFQGGNEASILKSIREQIFSLPDETILFPGHGPNTTVAKENAENPFLISR